MFSSMHIGNTATVEFLVSKKMQPQFDGIIIHPVCSTWDLAHQFEIAARKALVPHLEESEEGIGSHLEIDHIAPAALGSTVKVTATISELDESTVVCTLEAISKNTVVATGKQIQRVYPAEIIRQIISNANN